MNRRAFVTGLGAVLAGPLGARAQQAGRIYRVGFLGTSNPAANPDLSQAFADGLKELGYVEGVNLILEYRWADSVTDRLPTLAVDLVKANVEVIVAPGNASVLAAKRATSTIPIVAPLLDNPVETGLVASLSRPGGMVTGLSFDVSPEQATKRLEFFKQLVPAASRVAALWNPKYPGHSEYWPATRSAAASLNISLYGVEVLADEDLGKALGAIAKAPPGGLFIWADPILHARRREICEFALKRRIATLGPNNNFPPAGCLISYSTSLVDLFRRSAGYVDKILKGAKPAELPISQPTKFELVINAATARGLGLTIPQSLLLRADQVIE